MYSELLFCVHLFTCFLMPILRLWLWLRLLLAFDATTLLNVLIYTHSLLLLLIIVGVCVRFIDNLYFPLIELYNSLLLCLLWYHSKAICTSIASMLFHSCWYVAHGLNSHGAHREIEWFWTMILLIINSKHTHTLHSNWFSFVLWKIASATNWIIEC